MEEQFNYTNQTSKFPSSPQYKSSKKREDLNFKKFLLCLSSVGNFILGGLLVIMGIQAMRFNLDSIFVADKGLLSIGIIIVIYSIICLFGVITDGVITLLIVYFNSILTMIFISIFSLGALSMNYNIIDWIDNHWDVIRTSVFSMDMNKFKNHVTTEINSLGIFSLTINATLIIKMICISNLLGFKNIIIAISPLTNLIFSIMSTGLIAIGFYTGAHYYYTSITTWSSSLLIILGLILFVIGIFGYKSITKINKNHIKLHVIMLFVCLLFLIIACIGFFYIASTVDDTINNNWPEIHKSLEEKGYNIRKSYLINQIVINLKFAGFFTCMFIAILILSLLSSIHQYSILG